METDRAIAEFLLYYDYWLTYTILNAMIDERYCGKHYIYTQEEFYLSDLTEDTPYQPYKTKAAKWLSNWRKEMEQQYTLMGDIYTDVWDKAYQAGIIQH